VPLDHLTLQAKIAHSRKFVSYGLDARTTARLKYMIQEDEQQLVARHCPAK
jgi:hypothetical protein